MKPLAFLLLFLFLHYNCVFSQNIKLPLDSASWCYTIHDDDGSQIGYSTFSFLGDTTINNKGYQKIDESGNIPDWFWEDDGYIRKDSGKVYFIPKDSSREFLIYDFNMSIGDSIYVKWAWPHGGYFVTLTAKDSVLTNNGYRTRFTLTNEPNYYGIWIEGIGNDYSTGTLTRPAYQGTVSGGKMLECFTNNSVAIYPYNCSGCLSIGVEEIESKRNVILYPNPFSDLLYLKDLEKIPIDEIKLIDLKGNVLKRFTEVDNGILQLVDLAPGIYLLEITFNNHTVVVKKVVKSGK